MDLNHIDVSVYNDDADTLTDDSANEVMNDGGDDDNGEDGENDEGEDDDPSSILPLPIGVRAIGTDTSAPARESVPRATPTITANEQQRSPHPPNNNSDLTLSQEESARQQFIDDWRGNIKPAKR